MTTKSAETDKKSVIKRSKSDSEIIVKKKSSNLLPHGPLHGSDITTQLYELEDHDSDVEFPLAKFYDVEIKIGEAILRAHRAHLSQQSSYFEKIFEKNRLPFVTLDLDPSLGIAAPMLELILQWMYTEKIKLQVTNLDNVLKAAERLGMNGLKLTVNRFLLDLCEKRGPMMVHELAVNNNLEGIKYYTMKYACRNFLQLVNKSSFVKYSQKQVIQLLSNDHLATPSEKFVFDAAVAWLKAKWRKRRACLPYIMECIRFPAMSLEELKECCQSRDRFIVNHPAVIGPFFKAFLYRMAQGRGYAKEYEHLGQSALNCRHFADTSSELQNFTTRLLYRSLLTVQARKCETLPHRTKSSIL